MKKYLRQLGRLLIIVFLTVVLFVPGVILAQETNDSSQTQTAEQVDVLQQPAVTTGKVSLFWRILQIISFVGLLASLGGMTYGIVLWRTGSQNNEILRVDRGRRIVLLYVVIMAVFLILLIITFVVIRRQQARLNQQSTVPVEQLLGDGLGARNALLLVEAVPVDKVPIRNVLVQLLFNQSLTLASVENNIEVIAVGADASEKGTWNVSDAFVTFRPADICPSPNEDVHCFAENTAYNIKFSSDLTSIDGDKFRCAVSQTTGQCILTFTTGDQIDNKSPTVSMTLPFENEGVPVDSSVLVEALAKDDVSVASIEFLVDDQPIGYALIPEGKLQAEFRGSTLWETLNLTVQSQHKLLATARDLAGKEGVSKSVTVELLPIYCFDGVKNQDEEGLDCGGPSCRACQGSVCEENHQCASGLCFNGICQDFPVIEDMIENNGAENNYITLRGKNFRKSGDCDGVGTVVFLGNSGEADDVVAGFPHCDGFWNDNEIVTVIPKGAKNGPIKVKTACDLYDTTGDDKGIKLDFTVNEDSRPGICSINPTTQVIGESIQVLGTGFGVEKGDVLFGQFSAGRIEGWSVDSIGKVFVPPLEPGSIPVVVEVVGKKSNPVVFKALKSPTLPQLLAINPDKGPVGQMFSLQGENLSTSTLVKFLNPRTGEITLADSNIPEACSKLQSSTQRAFRVPRLDVGTYQVFVETSIGRSNTLGFTVTQGERLPGLCGMNPDNGPLGIEITLIGEGFGSKKGGIRFTPRIDEANVLSWSDGEVRAVVPPTVQTGPVQVIHSQGALSNPFVFTINQCSPDTCETGFVCCSSGACQVAGSCVDSVPFCKYSWTFSTGDDLGGAPRVIDQADCKTNTQSPSPYKDIKSSCLNAGISARFTHNMEDSTLTANNIILRRCNAGTRLDTGECKTEVRIGNVEIINSEQPGEGFVAVPNIELSPDTWYRAELTTGIKAVNGFALQQPYSWFFKTQIGIGSCAVNKIEVTPPNAILRELRKQQTYTGVPTALNCSLLNPNSYSWHWLSSNTAQASVITTTKPSTKATSVGPTEPGPPVEILGGIPNESKEDKGLLSILLLSPTVVNKYPNCSTACVNAALGAKFDQAMQISTITGNNGIQLHECSDPTCSRQSLTSVGVKSIKYNETEYLVSFLPTSGILKQGASYRVILQGLRSKSGLLLGGLNYDFSGDGSLDSYSWIFKVKNEDATCVINRVDIVPSLVFSYLIGEKFDYLSFPVSPPDACNANGQVLNPLTFNWGWDSSKPTIGSVTNRDIVENDSLIDPYQVVESVGSGKTVISAETQSKKGQSNFEVVCGYKNDDACPSPATLQTFAVGADSCCHPRPQVSFTNPAQGSTQVCTTLAVQVQFDQFMDDSSLLNNIFLEYNNGSATCPNSNLRAWSKIKYLAQRTWSWLIPSINAQAQQNWCLTATTVNSSQNTQGSFAQLFPKMELRKNVQYRVRISGDVDLKDGIPKGVRNRQGVAMSGEINRIFTTGEAQCSLDLVEVVVSPEVVTGKDIIFCAGRNDCFGDANSSVEGNQHSYQAIGRDKQGYAVPATFRWLVEGDPIIHLNTAEGDMVEVTGDPTNGDAVVTVYAQGIAPSKGNVSKSVDVKVFICENPWPSLQNAPYQDNAFNFDLLYCRDFGEPGKQDDLPGLSDPIIGENVGDVRKEWLFIVGD